MADGVINGFYNLDMLEKLNDGKCQFIDINLVEENPKNVIYDEKPLDKYIEMIKEEGLLQPLGAYKKDDKYVLITGHNRLKAIKAIFAENLEVDFYGKKLTNTVPLFEHPQFKSDNDELRCIIDSNHERRLSEAEAYRISIEVERIYNEEYALTGKKPKGVTKREMYAEMAHISGKTVERYLEVRDQQQSTNNDLSNKVVHKKKKLTTFEKVIKSLDSANRSLSIQGENPLSIDEVKTLKTKLKQLLKALG